MKVTWKAFEIEVLRGCHRALSEHRIRLIQLEWNMGSIAAVGTDRRPVAELLGRYGYRLYRPNSDGALVPLTHTAYGPDVFTHPDPQWRSSPVVPRAGNEGPDDPPFGPLPITVLGVGYLGAAHAACLAELGFDVLGVDTDARRIAELAAGQLPFFEPGLESLLRCHLDSGRLRFTTSYREAAAFGAVHYICVGTPQRPSADGADLRQLDRCVSMLAPLLASPCLVVGKSTVPVGTAAALAGTWLDWLRQARRSNSPGIQNSCARGMQWKTRCAQTGSLLAYSRSGLKQHSGRSMHSC